MTDTADILALAVARLAAGRPVALATVVETWGSAPRGVGSRMLIDADGGFEGSVSGGCVEAEVLATAEDVLADGRAVLRRFSVSDDRAAAAGLGCGGAISVFVERLDDRRLATEIGRTVAGGGECVTTLDLGDGRRAVAAAGEGSDPRLDAALAGGGDALVQTADGRSLFVEVWRPRLRLMIVGAVHVAQSLAPIAVRLGYEVTVVDPRAAFATAERFPGIALDRRRPEEAFADRPPDRRTAVVALAHLQRLDDPAIAVALAGPAFYVGALGSRATAEKRRERLRAAGFDEAAVARLHAPIGLDIGAAGPAEIAVAVAAEITAALRRRDTGRRRSAA